MIRKIISGGQTGADRAALDIAIKFNIKHGGWVPRGRKTEDGPLPEKYRMQELGSDDYRERTRQNIVDSHGTLIISYGELTGGSKLTRSYAKVVGRPNCRIDLLQMEAFEAAMISKSFILENQIGILNVAGPRLSHFPGIYQDVRTILETVLYLLFLDTGKDKEIKTYFPSELETETFPEILDEAIKILEECLPLRAKTYIAKLEQSEIQSVYFTMLDSIRYKLGFDTGNPLLLKQCRKSIENENVTIEDAVMEILKQLKISLESTHKLRVVK